MLLRQFVRNLHCTRMVFAAEKSNLSTLRKKTGYTFANCKKALELHNNDLIKAEQWLREQAQSLGWSKATKLEGRSTKQGLVGVLVNNNIGAMVEVNCETDFVARNDTFQEFVQSVTQACAAHVSTMPTNDTLSKIDFDGDSLKQITLADGKTLSDHLALIIGKVGENASLRRATCYKVTNSVTLASFAHPSAKAVAENVVQLGKFGALVALHDNGGNDTEAQRNLCQHIVGMNPIRIGVVDVDKPAENKDDERSLLWQEYLLDPSVTVGEALEESKIDVVDFKRFECGETLPSEKASAEVAEAAAAN